MKERYGMNMLVAGMILHVDCLGKKDVHTFQNVIIINRGEIKMMSSIYPSDTSGRQQKCRRCGNGGMILENGYCIRCDDAMFGKPKK